LYEPYVRKHIETGLKILNVSTEKANDDFHTIITWYKRSFRTLWFGLFEENSWACAPDDFLPTTEAVGRNVARGAEKPHGAPFCRAYTKF
jgi:hypothetical protein